MPVLGDAVPELLETRGPVAFAVCVPGEGDGNQARQAERPASDDEVSGAVELEQKEVTGLQRAELARSRGLPEIHLFQIVERSQVLKPLPVGESDVGPHAAASGTKSQHHAAARHEVGTYFSGDGSICAGFSLSS